IPLPPYSPDLNPIEKTFGALKRRRKSMPQGTTIDQLILSYY
ncbi:MAG: transposase, partial [Micavibrio sp.]|nr:transposase [Micavibrio sp.]